MRIAIAIKKRGKINVKMFEKIFAIMVSLAILIACIPTVSVFAATLGGTCGENVTWSLDTESGVLPFRAVAI